MKRVLHLFPVYKIGGAPVNVLRFIKESNGKIENYSAALKADDLVFKEFVDNTSQCFDVDISKINLQSFLKLLKIIRKIKPDIVHANGKGGAMYAFLICPFFKGKLFYTFRGFHIKFSGLKQKLYVAFERLFSMMYSKSIAVSESERKLFLKVTGVKADRVKVIGNGVDVVKKELPLKIEEVSREYKYNLVSLSRVAEVKDLETMIRAFDLLEDENISLNIMGGYLDVDLQYKNKIESIVSGLPCNKRVYFWGDIKRAGDYLNNFDLYLSTSLSEGLPTAIIEAGLSEIPVVASNCNGNIDLIHDGKTGYLFQTKDYKGLADKITLAINEFESQQQANIIANNLAQMGKYSVKSHTNKILELYMS